jgi:hypothetical protein
MMGWSEVVATSVGFPITRIGPSSRVFSFLFFLAITGIGGSLVGSFTFLYFLRTMVIYQNQSFKFLRTCR